MFKLGLETTSVAVVCSEREAIVTLSTAVLLESRALGGEKSNACSAWEQHFLFFATGIGGCQTFNL